MNKIIKIIIGGFIILTMYLLLLKPSIKCSNDKPYLENGKCVASCASGKRDYKKCINATENCPHERSNLSDGVCVASCPPDKPDIINGICSPCSSNKHGNIYNENDICVSSCSLNKVNDNGFCLSSCPPLRPVIINGVCNPCSSNTNGNIYNNDGICVSSCPYNKQNDNGVCKSIIFL
jgi:hypothetical protein